jgi:hypothetical protein
MGDDRAFISARKRKKGDSTIQYVWFLEVANLRLSSTSTTVIKTPSCPFNDIISRAR